MYSDGGKSSQSGSFYPLFPDETGIRINSNNKLRDSGVMSYIKQECDREKYSKQRRMKIRLYNTRFRGARAGFAFRTCVPQNLIAIVPGQYRQRARHAGLSYLYTAAREKDG